MEENLHQLIGSLSHYLQGFLNPGGFLAGFLNHQRRITQGICIHESNSESEPLTVRFKASLFRGGLEHK